MANVFVIQGFLLSSMLSRVLGGSDWSLLTGGRCLEVVVNTGLTVQYLWQVRR